jgi:glycosyltransferase involved in cell wall biosynthesis
MHNLKTFMPSVFIRSITKKPLIYDSHELQLGKREKNKFRTAFLNFIDKKKEKFLIKKANLIIQASTERAVFFSKYYKTTLPLVIENFAKFKSKTNLKKSIYDDVPKNKDTVLGVFTGNITIGGNQEIENLIFAYQNLTDNIHLCLLGNIGEDTKKYIITLVKKLKIDNRVHILKPVLSEEVVSYISEADFAIIPIYNKTLNSRFSALNKVSESLMAGLALMASNNLNLRNLIYGNPYGKIGECFDVDNVEDIATKITEGVSFIQKNKSTVKNRIEKLSKETYNWEKQEEKLFSAIEKVLN